jgi:hypothetical protein
MVRGQQGQKVSKVLFQRTSHACNQELEVGRLKSEASPRQKRKTLSKKVTKAKKSQDGSKKRTPA